VPGVGFGGPGYFRISYTVPDRMIENSFKGFAEAFKTI
jgi:aspartate aminotransferase